MCQWKSRNVHGVGLGLCPVCRREGVLVRMIISRVKGRKKRQVFRYILMHLDTNTRSAKGGRSTATTMMLILIRAGENRACLHRISVLVSGRRYPPMASLRLLSLRNRRPQRSISFTFTLLVVGRGNNTGWRARRRPWSMTTWFSDRNRDGLPGREHRYGRRGRACRLRSRRVHRCGLLAMSLVVRCSRRKAAENIQKAEVSS